MDGSEPFADCLCPRCKTASLGWASGIAPPEDETVDRAIVCRACQAAYDVVHGVPFLGVYGEANFLGLLEIASGAGTYGGMDPRFFDARPELLDLLDEYHLSARRDELLRKQTTPVPSWFSNRYSEYVPFRALTADLELRGRKVLDVGAGLGFDSQILVRAGANVTCFDSCPPLFRIGRRAVAHARWVGGLTPLLPFVDQSFDVVVANAALHHMNNVPATYREMLRVLRPGGTLLTLGDPYRGNGGGEECLLETFKDHPAVLGGVNEGVPPVREFLDTLEEYADSLDTRVFTANAHAVAGDGAGRWIDLPHFREWSVPEAAKRLAGSCGSIAIVARLKNAVEVRQRPCPVEIIRPADYARHQADQATALSYLAPWMPPAYIDLPLLEPIELKFQLLNGWKPPVAGQEYRVCLRRARRFMTPPPAGSSFHIRVLAPHVPTSDDACFSIRIDGVEVLRRELTRGVWSTLSVSWPSSEPRSVSCVELCLESAENDAAALFRVRAWEVGEALPNTPPGLDDLEEFGLPALARLNLLGDSRATLLLSSDYAFSLEVINRLRALGLGVDAIAVEGQEGLLAREPGVAVRGTYRDPLIGVEPPRAASFDCVAVAARSMEEARQLAIRLRGDTAFGITEGGHCVRLDRRALAAMPVSIGEKGPRRFAAFAGRKGLPGQIRRLVHYLRGA